MENELPVVNQNSAPWGNKFLFTVGGFFACLVTGKIHNFAKLCGQARHETQNYTSVMFQYEGNAFGLHVGSYFKRADGKRWNGTEDAYVNVYTGITRFYRCWLDRIEWDEKRGVIDEQDPQKYYTEVATKGYIGTNPTQTQITNYVVGCMNGYEKVATGAKLLSNAAAVTNYGIFSFLSPGFKIALNISLLLAVIYGLWWTYNKFVGKGKMFSVRKRIKSRS